YKDIIFDGTKVVQGNMSASEEKNRYANLFTGGSYRDTRTGSQTGYVLRKFIPLTSNKYDQAYSYGTNLHIYVPYMRLADVYLMYAESALMASNSATGKADNYGKTAVDAINIVRDRAGVGHV